MGNDLLEIRARWAGRGSQLGRGQEMWRMYKECLWLAYQGLEGRWETPCFCLVSPCMSRWFQWPYIHYETGVCGCAGAWWSAVVRGNVPSQRIVCWEIWAECCICAKFLSVGTVKKQQLKAPWCQVEKKGFGLLHGSCEEVPTFCKAEGVTVWAPLVQTAGRGCAQKGVSRESRAAQE